MTTAGLAVRKAERAQTQRGLLRRQNERLAVLQPKSLQISGMVHWIAKCVRLPIYKELLFADHVLIFFSRRLFQRVCLL